MAEMTNIGWTDSTFNPPTSPEGHECLRVAEEEDGALTRARNRRIM